MVKKGLYKGKIHLLTLEPTPDEIMGLAKMSVGEKERAGIASPLTCENDSVCKTALIDEPFRQITQSGAINKNPFTCIIYYQS